jgi:hypothetical protein
MNAATMTREEAIKAHKLSKTMIEVIEETERFEDSEEYQLSKEQGSPEWFATKVEPYKDDYHCSGYSQNTTYALQDRGLIELGERFYSLTELGLQVRAALLGIAENAEEEETMNAAIDFAAADLKAASKMLDSIEWRSESLRKRMQEFLADAAERSIEHAVTWKLTDALEAEQTMHRYGELDAAIRNWMEKPEKPELEAFINGLRGKYMDDLLRSPWEGRSSSAGSNLVAQAYASSLVKVAELCDTISGYVYDCRDKAREEARKAAIEAETARYPVLAELGGTVIPENQLHKACALSVDSYTVVDELSDGFQIIKYTAETVEYALNENMGKNEYGTREKRTHAFVSPGRAWHKAIEELRAVYRQRR